MVRAHTILHSRPASATVGPAATSSNVSAPNLENLSIVEIYKNFENAINQHNTTASSDKVIDWEIEKPKTTDLSFKIMNNNRDLIGTVKKTADQGIEYSFNKTLQKHEADVVLSAAAGNELELKSDKIEDIVNILTAANTPPHNEERPHKKRITLDDATKQVLKSEWDSAKLGQMPNNIKKYLEEPRQRPDFR